MKNSIIGGEFEIDKPICKNKDSDFFHNGDYLYSSGRDALYNILLSVKENKKNIRYLMLPDYLCPSIINIANKFDFELIYYPLSVSLQIEQKKFLEYYKKNSAILLINYFGCVSTEEQILFLRELDKDICIIEDNVQAFFSMFTERNVDFSFTSFRKTFPLPDGGWVKTRHPMKIPIYENTFVSYKIAGGFLKNIRNYDCIDEKLYLQLLDVGEKYIDNNLDKKMSDISLALLSQLDLQKVKSLRKRNAKYIINGLNSIGLPPLIPISEEDIPLFVPIQLKNRDKIRKFFFDHGIYCPIHWPIKNENSFLLKGKKLKEEELSLIIDQRYELKDMDRILIVLEHSLHGI